MNDFDFESYSVCKEAYQEIVRKSKKFNLLIDSKSEIVKKHQIFYETLV